MKQTKTNQYILLFVIFILLIVTITFTVISIINYEKTSANEISIKLNQIYSSDYNLSIIDSQYFIGSYTPKTIDVIIDNTGQEIAKTQELISYENIIKMKDGRYLIYDNNDNHLKTYIFDGKNITELYNIEDVTYAKPLVYKGTEYDYIVGFYSVKDNNLNLYNLNDTNTVFIKNCSLIIDENKAGLYYINNENYLTVKNFQDLYGIIDLAGNTIIDYIYKDITSTKNNTFIALNENNKYGIINTSNETIMKFNYKVIKSYDEKYLLVNSTNKMALFDKDLNNLTGFNMKYDPLIAYDLRNTNSISLNKFSGNILITNNYLEDLNGTEYDNHNLYIIKNGKIWKDIKQKGYFTDTNLFIYDSNYNIEIYNENYEMLSKISLPEAVKIEKISTISDDIIMVSYYNQNHENLKKYYNKSGVEVSLNLNDLGDLYDNNYLFHSFIKSSDNLKTITIFTSNYESSTSITGHTIEVCKEYVVIDNAIYKIEISEKKV